MASESDVSRTDRPPHGQIDLVVTGILAESDSWESAVERVLVILCRALDWQVAEFWRHDGDELVLAAAHVSSERYRAMVDHRPAFGYGVGLPGRVWKSGGSIWSSELWADCEFKRSALATGLGLTTGLGVPVALEDRLLGVISMFSSQRLDPDLEVEQVVEGVGTQLAVKAAE